MCLFILALIGILLFYLSGEINSFILVDKTDGISFNLASGWTVLIELWPAMMAMFLIGVLFVLLLLKLVPKSK